MDLAWLLPSGIGWNVATLQFGITVAIGAFDIWFLWFKVWIPFFRAVKEEDRPFLWTGIGDLARNNREAAEVQERLKNGRR